MLSFATVAAAQDASSRILIYGDSNAWGWRASDAPVPTTRLPDDVRWPGVLRAHLGERVEIIENGLNLRTTDLDDAVGGGGQLAPAAYNGANALPGVLAANAPLDLVIIALGQNDLQAKYGREPDAVAAAMDGLVEIVRQSAGEIGTTYAAPDVLILAPIPLGDVIHPDFAPAWAGAQAKSSDLAAAMASHGLANDYPVIDVTGHTGAVAGIDGLHFTPIQHTAIARVLARSIAVPSSPATLPNPSPTE